MWWLPFSDVPWFTAAHRQRALSICWAGLLLGENLTWTTIVGGVAVILCAGIAVRTRLNPEVPTREEGPLTVTSGA
jgi:drug/metabolite transporter (DMT)-like permease